MVNPDLSPAPIDLAREADFSLGAMQVRPSISQIEINGRTEALQPRVMQVLVALVKAQGSVLSRDELIAQCWGGAFVGDDAVIRVIGRLRRLFEGNGALGVQLETIPRIGYRLVVRDADAEAQAPRGVEASPDRRVDWIALGIAALLALLFVIPLLPRDRPERVAVLSFDTLGDASLQSFADGLADEIIGVMSVNDLLAIPRAQSRLFRGAEMRAAAERVGAVFVLDGTVSRDGDELVVKLHVIDARENLTVWWKDPGFRRAASDAAYFQEQIATHVTDVLRCALVSRRPNAGKIDPQTLQVFLRACDMVHRLDIMSGQVEQMYEAARQVTERAPSFSRGWSMLAMACAMASRSNVPRDRAKAFRTQARAAAQRSRSLEGANGEGYVALSLIEDLRHWPRRQELLERALEVEPNSSNALAFQGNFLAEVGLMRDALDLYRRAVAIDPLSPSHRSGLVPMLHVNRHLPEMRREREHLYRVWPNSPSVWFNRFHNFVFSGQPDLALRMLDEGDSGPVPMSETKREAWRKYLRALRSDERSDLRTAVNEIADLVHHGQFDIVPAISAASLADEVDTAYLLAYSYLAPRADPAIGEPIGGASRYVLFMPGARAMRRDARFIGLLRDIGFVAYWAETGRRPDFCDEPNLPYDCETEFARRT